MGLSQVAVGARAKSIEQEGQHAIMGYKQLAQDLLDKLTTQEKVALQIGMDNWHTMPIERVGLPSIMMCDGPHGLRKQPDSGDHLGLGYSNPAVCFPSISKLACSWDKSVLYKVGNALAEQCIAEDVSVLLAPGINIKRNSLCGRNFEYFSEDPCLTGILASSYVDGVQDKGVGVSLKHFAANSQEYARLVNDSIIDDRALHEIYLSAFAKVVTTAKPSTIMCSYNKINGVLASQNPYLLTTLLREQWGYEGMTVSDWGAVSHRPASIEAGLDLQMPCDDYHTVTQALSTGELSIDALDRAVLRIIELVLHTASLQTKPIDHSEQHTLASQIASQCTVLAKNTCNMLPLSIDDNIAVIGALANAPHYQGGGSSSVNSTEVTSLLNALDSMGISYSYSAGYKLEDTTPDQQLIDHAVATATTASKVILVVGLPDICEYEGFDRQSLAMPDSITELIHQVTAVNGNTIAVVMSGAPVDMSWDTAVKAVLLDYMPGQNGGTALADILYGTVTPSGRLAESWPISHLVQSSQANFANNPTHTIYAESIFVGYRYYDKLPQYVKYPFGYGLSYTTFSYSDISVDSTEITTSGTVTLSLTLTNTGEYDGAEVVQIYASSLDNHLPCADKQLVAFDKIHLAKGNSKRISIPIEASTLAYYNTDSKCMVVDGGRYQLHVARHTQHILSTIDITVAGSNSSQSLCDTAPCYYNIQEGWSIPVEQFEILYGKPLPSYSYNRRALHTVDSTFSDIRNRFVGRIIYKKIIGIASNMADNANEQLMITQSLPHTPLRSIAMTQGFSRGMVEGLVDIINGKLFSGAHKYLRHKKLHKNKTKRSKQ